MRKLLALIENRPALAAFLLPFLAAAAAFSPTLWFSLVWDDAAVYAQQVPYFPTLASAFRAPTNIPNFNNMFYRPGVVLTYLLDDWLNRLFFGASLANPTLTAPIPHAFTALAHATVAGLVGLLAYRLFASRKNALFAALAAGLAFALHAAHLDSVAIASGRSDVLAALFVVAGALALLKWRDGANPAFLALSALCVFCGLLMKEVAVSALLLYPALWLLGNREAVTRENAQAKRLGVTLAALFAAASAYFALRYNLGNLPMKGAIPFSPDAVMNAAVAIAFYLWKTFFPWPNHLFILEPFIDRYLALAICLAFAAAVALLYWKAKADRVLIALALIWYFGALAPSFGPVLLKVFRSATAERYLYLPSAGACIAFGAVFTRLSWSRQKMIAAAGTVLAALLALTLFALPVYSRDLNFWKVAASQQCSREFALVWTSLGDIHQREGNFAEALEAYGKAGSPGIKTDIIITRVSANGYAETRMKMAEKALAARDLQGAYQNAQDAVGIFEEYPLKSIDEPRWRKNLGRAYFVLYKAKRALGADDRALLTASLQSLSEAIRMRNSDQEALNLYVEVSGAR